MWITNIRSAIYGQQKKVLLYSVKALLLLASKIWTRPHFLIGLSKHFLSPPISSGASYLTLGKVSGGAPPILWNFTNGTMCQDGLPLCQGGLPWCQECLPWCQEGLPWCQEGLPGCQESLPWCQEGLVRSGLVWSRLVQYGLIWTETCLFFSG